MGAWNRAVILNHFICFDSVYAAGIVHTELTGKVEFYVSNRTQRAFQALWTKKSRREVLLLDS